MTPSRPASIENRWDILYREYPEVYEAFSSVPYRPTVFEQLAGLYDLRGKTVLDVGAGTGKSSLALAGFTRRVIGLEREPAMLLQARLNVDLPPRERVTFLAGDALALPCPTGAVDLVTAITLALYPPQHYRAFIREGLRVAKERLVYVGIPPGWYGGHLYRVIENPYKRTVDAETDRIFRKEFHFQYQDVFSVQQYASLEQIVSLYGFIFGQKVIEHIQKEGITAIRWKYRVYWREITP